MIRKKWRDGEPVLSVETEDEFWKAVSTGEAVEVTRELGEKIGLMEEDVGYHPIASHPQRTPWHRYTQRSSSQPTLWGHATRDPLQGLARGLAPFDPQSGRPGKGASWARGGKSG